MTNNTNIIFTQTLNVELNLTTSSEMHSKLCQPMDSNLFHEDGRQSLLFTVSALHHGVNSDDVDVCLVFARCMTGQTCTGMSSNRASFELITAVGVSKDCWQRVVSCLPK